MKKFIKKEWFKIIVIILLSIVAISYVSGQYVYYQKQRIQLQEMQEEQEAKEKVKPKYVEIQRLLSEGKEDEARKILNSLSNKEYEIYKRFP